MPGGGDVIEMTYNHAIHGSGSIFLKSNEDGTIDSGGYRSNDDANSITGDGQIIDQINRVRASFEAPPVSWDIIGKNELDILSKMAASPVFADWTITLISGDIWGGKGKPVGDVQGNTNTGLITVKLAFGTLEKIS